MTTHVVERGGAIRTHLSVAARVHMSWLAAGLLAGFAVPFVFADTLELPRDVFYAIYITFVAAFFILWAKTTGQALRLMFRRRWLLAVGLGLLAAVILVPVVLGNEATARPDGIELIGALLWRGVAYGAADGLLLSAFPILAVFAIFEGTRARQHLSGKIAIGLAALAASMVMTGVYHLGYSDFRSQKVGQPVAGDVVWSAPTLLSLNPVGAPIAHAAMHVTAVLHSYETDLFLPPHK